MKSCSVIPGLCDHDIILTDCNVRAVSVEKPPRVTQCTPDISRSCISQNWIYPGRMLDPIFDAQERDIFREITVTPWTPIGGRQFFAKCAHRDSLCSRAPETIFREIDSSLPVNGGWNTCCAMASHARLSIDTSIVSQSRVQLIQCQCKWLLHIANQIKLRIFNQIVTFRPRCLQPPSCPDTDTVPQPIKSAWLVDIPLAVYAHQTKAELMMQNGWKYYCKSTK